MTGRHAAAPSLPPVITAGEPEGGIWCQPCQQPSRWGIPLFLDGQPAGGLELCLGCGTGHDRPGRYIVTAEGGAAAPEAAREPLTARLRLPRRKRPGGLCEHSHCARQARMVLHHWSDGWGDSRDYFFCSRRHRTMWREENDLQDNIRPAHRRCNQKKTNKLLSEMGDEAV